MYFVRRKTTSVLIAVMIFVASIGFSQSKSAYAATWRTAYRVTYAYSDGWGIPHYGAFFTGLYGLGYSFSGYSGAPPSPNWWGNGLNVALLEKTWLFSNSCWIMGQYTLCPDRWAEFNHIGLLQY